jgi:2-polyprenyl-3-methyl-5-hydroxy-6-metoxy-1,4-benzoquinol methylase
LEKAFMESKWDNFYSKEELHTKYPSEHVVRFLFSQFSRDKAERKNIKIVDAGCGAGRHTSLLAAEGFDTYAIDISVEALNATEDRLAKEGRTATYNKASMEKLPYDDSLDGLVSFGVLYYNDMDGLKNAVLKNPLSIENRC